MQSATHAENIARRPAPGQFPKSLRLLKHADFQAVYEQGKKHFSGNVTAFYRERKDSGAPRVGFAVGKALGGAVERNRIRRRLRAVVAARLVLLRRPLDVVVHPRRSVLNLEFSRLDAEIERLFSGLEKGKER